MSTVVTSVSADIGAPTLFRRLRSWWDNVRVMTRRNLIHVRRDPRDTCLSCYFNLFSGLHGRFIA